MDTARHRCRLRIFADYRQFYIWDPQVAAIWGMMGDICNGDIVNGN